MRKEEDLEKIMVKSDLALSSIATKTKTKFPKIRKKKNMIKLLKIYMISLLLFLISYILYYLSLTGCTKTEYECLTEERIKFFYKLGIATFFSSLFFSFLIKYLIKHKQWVLIIIYSIIFFIRVFSDMGEEMEHHGRFNMLGFFFFLFLDLIDYRIFLQFNQKEKIQKIINNYYNRINNNNYLFNHS